MIHPRLPVLIESFVHRLYKVPFVFADSCHVIPKISFLLEAKKLKRFFFLISFKRSLMFLSLLPTLDFLDTKSDVFSSTEMSNYPFSGKRGGSFSDIKYLNLK